jgi:hypothetical protein
LINLYIKNISACLWFFLNIATFRLLSITFLAFLPKLIMLPVAMHLFKTIMWWEEHWVDYYLKNRKGYFENLRRIRNNPVCLKTTMMAYEYVYAHPEEFES